MTTTIAIDHCQYPLHSEDFDPALDTDVFEQPAVAFGPEDDDDEAWDDDYDDEDDDYDDEEYDDDEADDDSWVDEDDNSDVEYD